MVKVDQDLKCQICYGSKTKKILQMNKEWEESQNVAMSHVQWMS